MCVCVCVCVCDLFVLEEEVFAVEMVRRGDSVPGHQQFPDVLADERVGVVVLCVHVYRAGSRCAAGHEAPGLADVLLPAPIPHLADGVSVGASAVGPSLAARHQSTLAVCSRSSPPAAAGSSFLIVLRLHVFFLTKLIDWRLFRRRRQLLNLRCRSYAQHDNQSSYLTAASLIRSRIQSCCYASADTVRGDSTS